MRWYLAGEAVSFPLPILVSGEPAIYDEGSLRFTLRINDGTIPLGYDHLVLPSVGTDVVLTTFGGPAGPITMQVSAALNLVEDPAVIESRFIRVDYAVEGVPYKYEYSYKLHPFLLTQVTPADVRGLLGATPVELPDEDITVVESYYQLVHSEGERLTTALAGSGIAAIAANDAIALYSAIECLPGLRAKFRKIETIDNSTVQRQTIDFEKLEQELRMKLAVALNTIQVLDSGPTSISPSILQLTSPTDVITG